MLPGDSRDLWRCGFRGRAVGRPFVVFHGSRAKSKAVEDLSGVLVG